MSRELVVYRAPPSRTKDIGLISSQLPQEMAKAVRRLDVAHLELLKAEGSSCAPAITRFRSKLREDWKALASIFQECRHFATDVQTLYRYFRETSYDEFREVLQEMMCTSEKVLEMLRGAKPLDACSALEMIASRYLGDPYEESEVEVYALREAQERFESAIRRIDRLCDAMEVFWRDQLALIYRIIDTREANQIGLTFNEAVDLANKWASYDGRIMAAVSTIHHICDMVVVEPHVESRVADRTDWSQQTAKDLFYQYVGNVYRKCSKNWE
ncbi:hypothetical protein FRC17_009074 [Serendipita sp. 399]|nr:hypothetical protein FRC17_009074 [Serendipita sp. 399]